jgi:hypothetical protein
MSCHWKVQPPWHKTRALLKQRHELRVQMEAEEFDRLLADDDDPPLPMCFFKMVKLLL